LLILQYIIILIKTNIFLFVLYMESTTIYLIIVICICLLSSSIAGGGIAYYTTTTPKIDTSGPPMTPTSNPLSNAAVATTATLTPKIDTSGSPLTTTSNPPSNTAVTTAIVTPKIDTSGSPLTTTSNPPSNTAATTAIVTPKIDTSGSPLTTTSNPPSNAGPLGNKCTINPNYVSKSSSSWTNDDRNTAIWLLNNFQSGSASQTMTNSQLGPMLDTLCGTSVSATATGPLGNKCTINPNYVSKSSSSWTNDDRNTAIWLLNNFQSRSASQTMSNSQLGSMLDTLCGTSISGHGPQLPSPRVYLTQNGKDYSGNDLGTVPGSQCGPACDANSACVGFIVNPNDPTQCWLKSKFEGGNSNANRNAYYIDGTPLTMAQSQQWPPNSVRTLKNKHTGQCLDHQYGIHAVDCNGGSFQRWYPKSNGFVGLEDNMQNCLDTGMASLQGACNGGSNYHYKTWTIQPDGSILNAGNGQCLDVGQSNFMGNCNGGDYQKWE
jgi:hypothetical protein